MTDYSSELDGILAIYIPDIRDNCHECFGDGRFRHSRKEKRDEAKAKLEALKSAPIPPNNDLREGKHGDLDSPELHSQPEGFKSLSASPSIPCYMHEVFNDSCPLCGNYC